MGGTATMNNVVVDEGRRMLQRVLDVLLETGEHTQHKKSSTTPHREAGVGPLFTKVCCLLRHVGGLSFFL